MRTKPSILGALILSPLMAFAAKPDPATFTLNVHVKQSEVAYGCNSSFLGNPGSCGMRLVIFAIIKGQKLELRANKDFVLRPGDYKAREKTEADTSGPYTDGRVFEFLMTDGKILTFEVVGETED